MQIKDAYRLQELFATIIKSSISPYNLSAIVQAIVDHMKVVWVAKMYFADLKDEAEQWNIPWATEPMTEI